MSDEIKDAEKALKKLVEKTKKREFTKLSTEARRLKTKAKNARKTFSEKQKKLGTVFKSGELYVDDYSNMRNLSAEAKDLHFRNLETRRVLDEQKNEHAAEAFELGEIFEKLGIESGEFIMYQDDELGDLIRMADYPSGSREWLEERQKGIGGSDVGSILKIDPDWGDRDKKEVFNSKIYPITDDQVEEQEEGQLVFNDSASRGNAWESLIGKMFADANPEIQVIICKASWAKKYERIMRVNFDFLVSKEKGSAIPDGLLEIKTSASPADWGNPKDGIDAIPKKYRAQVLHGILSAGEQFTWGSVAVLIDGHDFRFYTFEMTPELWKEAKANATACRKFWDEVKEAREKLAIAEADEAPIVEAKKPTKGFTSTLGRQGDAGDSARQAMIFEIAQVMKTSPQTVIQRYRSIREYDSEFEHRNASEAFENLYKAALSELFTPYDRIVSVDLETSGNTVSTGSIIEVGISVRDSNGKEIEKVSELYGITDNEFKNGGTGAVDVHNILPEDIEGLEVFDTPETQKKMLKLLKSGLVIAHNKSFEVSWFRQYIPGFTEAELAGEINIIDTMDLCKRFLPDAPGNRLQDFMEYFGMEYVDMHRAHKDAFFTADAFFKLLEMLSK